MGILKNCTYEIQGQNYHLKLNKLVVLDKTLKLYS